MNDYEDEKIKSAILGFLEGSGQEIIVPGISMNDAISWLEKQGNTDSIIEKAKIEKQRVLITETDGNANIDWDTRRLDDARKLLECGLQYINAELEKQGNDQIDDSEILQRFSFYIYKDEPDIIYLANVFVNEDFRNKGVGSKIIKISDIVASSMGSRVIRLQCIKGSDAERLYKNNGYIELSSTENDQYVWLEKQNVLIDKLVKYREWLISESERRTKKENDKTNSNAGKHYWIGAANALIDARAEFEEIFDYDSWSEKQGTKSLKEEKEREQEYRESCEETQTEDSPRHETIECSDDERIRKWIKEDLEIKYVKDGVINNILADKAFAWLEKQKHIYETTKDKFYLEGFEEGRLYEKQNEQNPTENVEPKFKVKYADIEYNVLEVKDIAGITYYGIEDEPNHIDYVLPENCKIVNGGYNVKEKGSPYPTKSAIFSEQNPAWSEEDERLLSKLQTYVDMESFDRECNCEDLIDWLKKKSEQKYLDKTEIAEQFARIIRGHLTQIDKEVQLEFENLYTEITGKKMYGGYND